MAENIGWISIHRKIQKHWIWKDANKLKWWLDMLLTVNTSDSKVNIGYELFDCKRGQSLLSIQSWADRWGVSKDTARNFLTLLEKENMITRVSLGKSTQITICKYDIYQSGLHVKKRMPVRDANTNNNNNKDNNINNSSRVQKPSLSDGIYPACMDLYNQFILQRTGVGAKINKATGSALNKIIAYLKTQVKNKDNLSVEVPNALNYIFSHFDQWDNFHKKTLTLNQIENNLINIINSIKNGKSIAKDRQQSKYAS